jgi:hypothetical protein
MPLCRSLSSWSLPLFVLLASFITVTVTVHSPSLVRESRLRLCREHLGNTSSLHFNPNPNHQVRTLKSRQPRRILQVCSLSLHVYLSVCISFSSVFHPLSLSFSRPWRPRPSG